MIILTEAAPAPAAVVDPVDAAVLALVEAAHASETAYTPDALRELVEAAAVAEGELVGLEEGFFGSLTEEYVVRHRGGPAAAAEPTLADKAKAVGQELKGKAEGMVEKAKKMGISQERKDRWLKWIDEKIAHFEEKAAAGGASKGWEAIVVMLKGLRATVSALPARKPAAAAA